MTRGAWIAAALGTAAVACSVPFTVGEREVVEGIRPAVAAFPRSGRGGRGVTGDLARRAATARGACCPAAEAEVFWNS